jgi:hypothetical protein
MDLHGLSFWGSFTFFTYIQIVMLNSVYLESTFAHPVPPVLILQFVAIKQQRQVLFASNKHVDFSEITNCHVLNNHFGRRESDNGKSSSL